MRAFVADWLALHAPHARRPAVAELDGGTTTVRAVTYEHDGELQSIVVKCPTRQALRDDPLAAERECHVLAAVHAAGLPVPAPLFTHRASFDPTMSGLAMRKVSAEIRFDAQGLGTRIDAIADVLARIHSLAPSPPLVEWLWRVDEHPDPALADVPSSPMFDTAQVRRVIEATCALPAVRADLAAAPECVLHGDLWPGNVLWAGGALAAVIDWEDARLGNAHLDVAIARFPVAWIHGPDASRRLARRYAALRALDPWCLALHDLIAALREVRILPVDPAEWGAFFERFGRHDLNAQTVSARVREFVAAALGTCESALSQDGSG